MSNSYTYLGTNQAVYDRDVADAKKNHDHSVCKYGDSFMFIFAGIPKKVFIQL